MFIKGCQGLEQGLLSPNLQQCLKSHIWLHFNLGHWRITDVKTTKR